MIEEILVDADLSEKTIESVLHYSLEQTRKI
jgi:hypothetical protein